MYPQSLSMVSSGLPLSEIQWLFPSLSSLNHLGAFNSFLKLDIPGFWASRCSWFSFSNLCFSFHLCRIHPGFIPGPFLHFRSLSTSQLFFRFWFFTSSSRLDIVHQLSHLCPILTVIAINSICKVLYCLENALLTMFHLSSIALPTLLLSFCFSLNLNLGFVAC